MGHAHDYQDMLDGWRTMQFPHGFFYLASSYTKHPLGRDVAFTRASMAAGWLVRQGVHVFSPIAHSHPIAEQMPEEMNTYSVWLPLDKSIAEHATGLIILCEPHWEESHGVGEELRWFKAHKKPIFFLPWPLPIIVPPYVAGALYWVRLPANMRVDDAEPQWITAQYWGDDSWHLPGSATHYPSFIFTEIGGRVLHDADLPAVTRPEPHIDELNCALNPNC